MPLQTKETKERLDGLVFFFLIPNPGEMLLLFHRSVKAPLDKMMVPSWIFFIKFVCYPSGHEETQDSFTPLKSLSLFAKKKSPTNILFSFFFSPLSFCLLNFC